MEILAGLSVVVLVLVALFIAIKTFALWRRTRGLPELLLATYLSCATVTGYPLAIAMTQVPVSRGWWLHVGGTLVMSAGWVALFLFTLTVFRPNALWARLLVAVSLAAVFATTIAYIVEVSSPHPRPHEEMVGMIAFISSPVGIAYFWTTFESLSYHRQLKLRLRLGLSDAVVVNRVLLWGLMALAAGSALVFNMVALLLGSYMSPLVVLLSSIVGVAHAGCLFFAFHSPAWYRSWLTGQAPAPSR